VSLTAIAREFASYKLHLTVVQKVRWEKRGHYKIRGLYFFYGNEKKIINPEQDFCTPQNSISGYDSRIS
jgi:hypothetical protein